jgi:hypothetical protein
LTGYVWTVRKMYPQHVVIGALVNAIEVKNLPMSDTKCKTHGVPYRQCGRHHATSEMYGPYVRTPYVVEKWRESAIGLAKRLRGLEGIPLTRIHELPMEGMFNGGCGAYGGCEFVRFCEAGRREEMVEAFLTGRKEREGG